MKKILILAFFISKYKPDTWKYAHQFLFIKVLVEPKLSQIL